MPPDIVQLHASLLRLAPDWHMAGHVHAGMHELIVVLEGRIRTDLAGSAIGGGAGTALLYPAGIAHEEWAQGGRPLVTVCIGWTGPRPAGGVQVADARGRITELARWLAELNGDPAAEARQLAPGLLAALLHEFARPARSAGDDLVARVRAWALPRLGQPIALAELARSAGLSRFHFVRAFRAAAGLTPMRWLRQQRLQAARTLLLTTGQPLRAIASQVGFADEFQLSRVFRREVGTPPSRLRGALVG